MSAVTTARTHILDAICMLRDEWLIGESTPAQIAVIDSLCEAVHDLDATQAPELGTLSPINGE